MIGALRVETLHRCYKHTENVHVTFCRPNKRIFDKILAFSTATFQTLVFSIVECVGVSLLEMGQGVGTGVGTG